MTIITKVLKGEYRDSLFLMRFSEDLSSWKGVVNALVVMGTPSNLTILDELGLLKGEACTATADDLVIAFETNKVISGNQLVDRVLDDLRKGSRGLGRTDYPSLTAALKANPQANVVSISVSGEYAAPLAHEAIAAGRNVFCFSSNVSQEDEIALKREAVAHGLLMMGPDCGTTYIDGLGLGFANKIHKGGIGVVSASGSGLQEFAVLVDRAGGGLSQAIGVGSRDLISEVAGMTTFEALNRMAKDDLTEVIAVLAKKSTPEEADRVAEIAASTGLPVVMYLADERSQANLKTRGQLFLANTIEEAANLSLFAIGLFNRVSEDDEREAIWIDKMSSRINPSQKWIRGLYAGGSLRGEARNVLTRILGNVYTETDHPLPIEGHILIDLGAEEFTQGRAHPFIDPRLRGLEVIKAANDPAVAVLLIDVVLGWGSHHDPAGMVLQALRRAKEISWSANRYLPVIASLCGSEEDPQGYNQQRQILLENDVFVASSSSQAALTAVKLLIRSLAQVNKDKHMSNQLQPFLGSECIVINVGLENFAQDIKKQGGQVVRVDWHPPVKRCQDVDCLLDKLF